METVLQEDIHPVDAKGTVKLDTRGETRGTATITTQQHYQERQQQPWPLRRNDAHDSLQARRNRVYNDLMRKWKHVSSSATPKPRSSHARVLGRQALSTRQRGESFSSVDSVSLKPSWGTLSDTVSPAAQSAWREQLLQRNLSRLGGVPMTVLLRQGMRRAEGYRVVIAAPNMTAKLTARAVIEGACLELPPMSSVSSLGAAEAAQRAGVPASGGGTSCDEEAVLAAVREEAPPEKRRHDSSEENGDGIAERNGKNLELSVTRSSVGAGEFSMNSSRQRASNLSAKVPSRGFHLVDLHAVVRNCVEWSHCLPKVEPCFRVGDNRDGILLGLLHALGGRLSCSSSHDVNAAVSAARRVSPMPAPPPRLFDRHVCRSPAVLRASVAAGVRLYEVDCADEVRRIRAARQRACFSADGTFESSLTQRGGGDSQYLSHPQPPPAEGIIRLAMPFRSRPQAPESPETPPDDELSTATTVPGELEAAFGAFPEAIVEIVAAAGRTDGDGSHSPKATLPSLLPIVGFSIDVGPACWDDALAAAALPPEQASRTSSQGVASPTLAKSIDAAVAVAVEAARHAAEAVIASATSTAAATDRANSTVTTGGRGSTSAPPPPPFSFRRLHVTGLGEGGARGEPLAALKEALSRHLSTVGSGTGSALGAIGRPIMVSADATEHLVAGGVWSTVTSIIGRKDVTPADCSSSAQSVEDAAGDSAGGVSGGEACRSGKVAEASGAMYYIDDGCYGSLSGALLRGVQTQPSPLLVRQRGRDILTPTLAGETETRREDREQAVAASSLAKDDTPSASVPCTVWGPTCDGLDCVSRVTPLPGDMEAGRDWLFFADTGMRGGADATGFNGLKPLDCFYCVRQRDDAAASAAPFASFSS